jgi:hypothetical protein
MEIEQMIRSIVSHKGRTMCARLIFEERILEQMIRCIASHKRLKTIVRSKSEFRGEELFGQKRRTPTFWSEALLNKTRTE